MRVRFWGTRGSIAVPGPGTNHFGGNTSCVELTTDRGDLLIFDCGTGARQLAAKLMAQGRKEINANILLGHTHWDHIQGFPFFTPAFVKGNAVAIYGPEGSRGPLHEVLAGQMEFTYFPVDLTQLPATITYHDLTEGIHTIGGTRVATASLLNGFRIQAESIERAGRSPEPRMKSRPYSARRPFSRRKWNLGIVGNTLHCDHSPAPDQMLRCELSAILRAIDAALLR